MKIYREFKKYLNTYSRFGFNYNQLSRVFDITKSTVAKYLNKMEKEGIDIYSIRLGCKYVSTTPFKPILERGIKLYKAFFKFNHTVDSLSTFYKRSFLNWADKLMDSASYACYLQYCLRPDYSKSFLEYQIRQFNIIQKSIKNYL